MPRASRKQMHEELNTMDTNNKASEAAAKSKVVLVAGGTGGWAAR
jgi:hypothetical protein